MAKNLSSTSQGTENFSTSSGLENSSSSSGDENFFDLEPLHFLENELRRLQSENQQELQLSKENKMESSKASQLKNREASDFSQQSALYQEWESQRDQYAKNLKRIRERSLCF